MASRTVASITALGFIGYGGLAAIPVALAQDQPTATAAIQVNDAKALPIDLAFSRRTFPTNSEKVRISPNARHIAYGVSAPAHRTGGSTLPSGLPIWMLGNRIEVLELATGKSRDVGPANSFSPAWSPDGTKLAYFSDEGGWLRAWIFDVAEGKSKPAAAARVKAHVYTAAAMPPTWSPDGRELLIPALPADEKDADPRPDFGMPKIKKGRGQPWDGVLVMSSGSEPPPPAAGEIEIFSHYGAAVDLAAVRVSDGATRVVLEAKASGRAAPAFARYSPTGRYLVCVSHFRPPAATLDPDEADLGIYKVGETEPIYVEKVAGIYDGYESYSADYLGRSGVMLAWHPSQDILLVVNRDRLRRFDCRGADEPHRATLAEELGAVSSQYLAFAPDCGSALIGISSDRSSPGNGLIALALAPLDGGPARKLPLPERFGGSRLVRQGGVSLWQSVPNSATFLTRDGSQTLARRLDLMTGEWTTAAIQPGAIECHGASPDGSLLVGTVESYDRPPDVYRLARDFTPQDRLTMIEPRLVGRKLGAAETFDTIVPLHDGRLKSVRTAVILPPGAKRGDRLPAIVTCYGGSDESRAVRAYGGGSVSGIPTPVFTSRGFAVVMTDGPIGPLGRPGQPIEELRDAVLPQVYRAAELGYVDIERLVLTGSSYGGYCTAALISATNLFRAAVAVEGVYDLPGDYGRLSPGDNHPVEWAESGQGRMGQPPWSELRRYLDNSPYYRADRIHTPLLIIHGRNDSRCPAEGAEKMFSALRRLNRTVQLAVYEGQGHAIQEWEQKHAADATERMLEFLRRHLKAE